MRLYRVPELAARAALRAGHVVIRLLVSAKDTLLLGVHLYIDFCRGARHARGIKFISIESRGLLVAVT